MHIRIIIVKQHVIALSILELDLKSHGTQISDEELAWHRVTTLDSIGEFQKTQKMLT